MQRCPNAFSALPASLERNIEIFVTTTPDRPSSQPRAVRIGEKVDGNCSLNYLERS
jgi:hypothetical protein